MTRRLFSARSALRVWPIAWRSAIALAAAGVLASQVFDEAPYAGAANAAARPAATVEPTPQNQKRAAAYPAIAAHPLFDASRSPWAPPPPPPPPEVPVVMAPPPVAPPPPRGYVLAGIILSADQHRALLRGSNGRMLQVTEGQALEGWTVQSIARNRLEFVLGEATYELAFPELKTSQTPRAVP